MLYLTAISVRDEISNRRFNLIQFNNFILPWYCTIAEANKNQPLITINMVKFFFYLRHVEADTKVISMWQPYTDMSISH